MSTDLDDSYADLIPPKLYQPTLISWLELNHFQTVQFMKIVTFLQIVLKFLGLKFMCELNLLSACFTVLLFLPQLN